MFNKTKNSPFVTKVLSTRSTVSPISNPQKDGTSAKVVPNSLPQISSSDSNNMSVHSSSSSNREKLHFIFGAAQVLLLCQHLIQVMEAQPLTQMFIVAQVLRAIMPEGEAGHSQLNRR